MNVRRRHLSDEWDAILVDEKVVFRARPAASVGFGPVSRPPFCRNQGGIQRSAFPVDLVGSAELIEQVPVEPSPDASLLPVAQPAPARHAAAAQLLRKIFPRNPGLEHEQDPRQGDSVGRTGPATSRLRLGLWP